MNTSIHFVERVQDAFRPSPRGVVGLVDDLLGLCRVHQLRINFQDSHCIVRRLGTDTGDALEVPLPRSVFRAALARIAALCNKRNPHSVTPYGGEGEVIVPAPVSENCVPPSTCYVSYSNTPSDQRLELRFSRSSFNDRRRFTVLLRDKRTVTVFGHALKYVQNASNSTDSGSYGILSRADGGEVLVALFRVSEVVGVFSGEIREPEGSTAGRDTHRQRALDDPSQGL